MGWLEIVVIVLKLIGRVWDAINEHNIEIKKKKTEALQSGLRGIVDRDASRITDAFDQLRNI